MHLATQLFFFYQEGPFPVRRCIYSLHQCTCFLLLVSVRNPFTRKWRTFLLRGVWMPTGGSSCVCLLAESAQLVSSSGYSTPMLHESIQTHAVLGSPSAERGLLLLPPLFLPCPACQSDGRLLLLFGMLHTYFFLHTFICFTSAIEKEKERNEQITYFLYMLKKFNLLHCQGGGGGVPAVLYNIFIQHE